MKCQRGFTLLELLISLTLIAILSLMTFMALRISLNAYRKGQERIEAAQREKAVVGLVKTQIGSAYPVRPQGKFYDSMREQQGDAQQAAASAGQAGFLERLVASRLGVPPLFQGEPQRMVFASSAPLFFKRNAGMSIISYALVPGQKGDTHFVENEEQYRGAQTFQEMTAGASSEGTIFFSGLEKGEFEYFGALQENDYRWHPRWDGEKAARLPLAVRISLTRKGGQRAWIVGLINAEGITVNPAGGAVPPALRTIIGGGSTQ
ncbi:MAG: prepilin-type N-terminal cleavage/methylation domain-containing protein [Acidobacteria bacterium]|nr:prepilin-type N-terminal cleavage/methylation domain-containing protein [Acidobacteriota bacterium]